MGYREPGIDIAVRLANNSQSALVRLIGARLRLKEAGLVRAGIAYAGYYLFHATHKGCRAVGLQPAAIKRATGEGPLSEVPAYTTHDYQPPRGGAAA